MKLRLGQPVNATDGPFGELSDIVVDPHAMAVTHVVVEPPHQHEEARLVPISRVSVEGDTITVAMDTEHLQRLDRVSHSAYVRLGEPIEVGDDWDLGTEDVMALPYWSSPDSLTYLDDHLAVQYDRIPKGECEIRRSSEVVSADERVVGHVAGFIADEDTLAAVVVESGLPGFRRRQVMPVSAIAEIDSDQIDLHIDKAAFDKLPDASRLSGPLGETSGFEHLASRVGELVAAIGRRRKGPPS